MHARPLVAHLARIFHNVGAQWKRSDCAPTTTERARIRTPRYVARHSVSSLSPRSQGLHRGGVLRNTAAIINNDVIRCYCCPSSPSWVLFTIKSLQRTLALSTDLHVGRTCNRVRPDDKTLPVMIPRWPIHRRSKIETDRPTDASVII